MERKEKANPKGHGQMCYNWMQKKSYHLVLEKEDRPNFWCTRQHQNWQLLPQIAQMVTEVSIYLRISWQHDVSSTLDFFTACDSNRRAVITSFAFLTPSLLSRVQVVRKEQGVKCPLPRENLLNFQVKLKGFITFLLRKLLVARNRRRG